MKLNKSFHIYALFQPAMHVRWIFAFCLAGIVQYSYAQAETAPDFMRSAGKIYVVAAVCLVILLAIFVYLIRLDRKISEIENRPNP